MSSKTPGRRRGKKLRARQGWEFFTLIRGENEAIYQASLEHDAKPPLNGAYHATFAHHRGELVGVFMGSAFYPQ